MFYKVDAARVSVREFWWETKVFLWIGIIVKLFKIRLRGSTDDLAVDSLAPFAVSEDQIPADILAAFAPALQKLHSLGFEAPMWHEEEDPFQATRNTLATLRHPSGRAWVRVQRRINFVRVPAKIKFFTTFISRTSDGYIVTGNGKYDLAWPSNHQTVRFARMAIEGVWARHQPRMGAAVRPIQRAELADAAQSYHASLRDFHLARGVFQPLNDDDMASITSMPTASPPTPMMFPPALPAYGTSGLIEPAQQVFLTTMESPAPPAPVSDLMEMATLDELRRLQAKQVNWRTALALLALSAFLFVLSSRSSGSEQSWEYAGMIVGILLFHELGHYFSMKMFGYRNLRMFFIPGFGAAVSGRHYNAPAWKKIIVSLMGPLPGIIVGGVMLILSGVWHNDLLYRIGLLAVILNAFNLIPILPFDGGWVAHAALFSRHPKIDVSFRLVAALLLLALGVYIPGGRFLTYIAVAGLFSLPLANKLAMIVGELRKVSGLGVSPDSQTIPTDTARLILARVRQRFTRNLTARVAAQHVASIFESLNARPPSIGATVGLLSLHGGAFLLAILTGVIAVGLHGRTSRPRLAAEPPSYLITENQIESNGRIPSSPRNTVVARFKTMPAARAAFIDLHDAEPATRFGQTLFVDFTRAEALEQRALFNHLGMTADDVFVESDKLHASIRLTFALPNSESAQQMFEDLGFYLDKGQWRLIPPWAPAADWPAEQRDPQMQLRRLIMQLEKPVAANRDHEQQVLQQIISAQRRADNAEAERLQGELQNQSDDAKQLARRQLQQQFGHADLIAKWAEIDSIKDRKQRRDRLVNEIAPLLGQWPKDQPDDTLVTGGFAFKTLATGPRVICGFAHTDTGLPAMTRWLISQRVTNIRYVTTSQTNADRDVNLDEE